MPEVKSWLAMAQAQLARPVVAEWKEGGPWFKGSDQQKMSVRERFIGFNDAIAKRSFIINDEPEPDGIHRYTKIYVADLPEDGNERIKREQLIKFIHVRLRNVPYSVCTSRKYERVFTSLPTSPQLVHLHLSVSSLV
jgi:hypothetical protein